MPILTVTSRYLSLIQSGRKTSTIRLTCKVKRGDRLTFTNYRSSVATRCTDVACVSVAGLTARHATDDGFASLDELLAALRSHYALTAETPVWIIRFARNDSSQSDFALT